MLNCEQFQWQTGADPGRLSWRQRVHWLTCRACARYLRAMRALDRQIERALNITLSLPTGAVTKTDRTFGPHSPPSR